jgi:hypothetical protein
MKRLVSVEVVHKPTGYKSTIRLPILTEVMLYTGLRPGGPGKVTYISYRTTEITDNMLPLDQT